MEKFCIAVKAGRCLQALQNKVKKKPRQIAQVKCLCYFFSCRQSERGEEGDADSTIHQIPNSDQSPQEKKEAPGESDCSWSPPEVPETKKDEGKEADEDKVKPQLSSSVTIDMADVHSSLELSTIAGASGICGVCWVFTHHF